MCNAAQHVNINLVSWAMFFLSLQICCVKYLPPQLLIKIRTCDFSTTASVQFYHGVQWRIPEFGRGGGPLF